MIKTWYCLKNEFCLLKRNLLFIVSLLIILLYMSYNSYNFSIVSNDCLGLIDCSAHIIVIGLLFFIMLGITLIRNEQNNSCIDVFMTIKNSYVYKVWGKFFCILLLDLCLSLIYSLFVTIYFKICNMPMILFIKAYQYIFLYHFTSWMISGIIGIILALNFKSRKIYPIAIIIWSLLGPLNMNIFKVLMTSMGGVNLLKLAQFLNLGQSDPHENYNLIYGFQLELSRWIEKGIWIIVLLITLYVISLIKNKSFKIKNLILCLLVLICTLIPCVNILVKPRQVVSSFKNGYSPAEYDYSYYLKNTDYDTLKCDKNFKVKSYDITLNTFMAMSAKVKTKVEITSDCTEIIFTLYRDLKIKNIYVNNNKINDFERIGDYIKIPMNSKKNDVLTLTFEYLGTSSPYFFANDQAIMLPGFFAWYPMAGVNRIMVPSNDSLLYICGNYTDESINFSVNHVNKNKAIFSNLKEVSKNHWEGISNGVTLISGMVNSNISNGYKVCYPVTQENILKDIPSFVKALDSNKDLIKEYFDVEYPTFKNIIFTSVKNPSNTYPSNLYFMNDHIIINMNYHQYITMTATPYEILSGLMKNQYYQMQNYFFRNLLSASFKYYCETTGMLDKDNIVTDINYLINDAKRLAESTGLSEENRAIAKINYSSSTKVKDFLDKNMNSKEKIKYFFTSFYKEMGKSKILTDIDIEKIINNSINSTGGN